MDAVLERRRSEGRTFEAAIAGQIPSKPSAAGLGSAGRMLARSTVLDGPAWFESG
jgi:hypothetical protein